MGKYLKKFDTHNEYVDYATNRLILPNVSYCVDNNDVHYNPNFAVFTTFSGKLNDEYYTWLQLFVDYNGGGLKANDFFNQIVVDSTLLTDEDLNTDDLVITDITPSDTHEVTYYFKDYNTTYSFAGLQFENVVFPEGMTTLMTDTFFYTSVKNITLPESLTTIEETALNVISDLDTITIPQNVTFIGNEALHYINKNIIMMPTTPPTLEKKYSSSELFANNLEHIYVPANSVQAYKTATNWQTYASKIVANPNE